MSQTLLSCKAISSFTLSIFAHISIEVGRAAAFPAKVTCSSGPIFDVCGVRRKSS